MLVLKRIKIVSTHFFKKHFDSQRLRHGRSITNHKKEDIEIIEASVNKNIDLLKDSVYDSVYLDENGILKKTPFKFLLGHEALLLGIPKDVEEYLSNKKQKKESKNLPPPIDQLKVSLIKKVTEFAEKKIFH